MKKLVELYDYFQQQVSVQPRRENDELLRASADSDHSATGISASLYLSARQRGCQLIGAALSATMAGRNRGAESFRSLISQSKSHRN